jgi:hypothetical protein
VGHSGRALQTNSAFQWAPVPHFHSHDAAQGAICRSATNSQSAPPGGTEMQVPVAESWCGRQPNKRLEQAPPRF